MLSSQALVDARLRLRPTPMPQERTLAQPPQSNHTTVTVDAKDLPLQMGEQLHTDLCRQCRAVPCFCREPAKMECSLVQGLAHVRSGQIDGSTYAIAIPDSWSSRVLLYLHGTRPQGSPLVAEIDVFGDEFGHLLKEGWMIAAVSYRSHGLALSDALSDAVNLRQHLASMFGNPSMVIIEGRSMGGTAGLLLAERHPELFSAVVTVGAALLNARLALPQNSTSGRYANQEAGESKESITYRPLIPVIMAANESEVSPARAYMTEAWERHHAGDTDIIVPALWKIKRPGHNWLTDSERLNAVLHAVCWLTGGTFITRRGTPAAEAPNFEPTHAPAPTPAGMYVVDRQRRRVVGEVVKVSPSGCFTISIPRVGMSELGLRVGSKFRLFCDEDNNAPLPVRVTLDEYPYLHTPEYGWCAVIEPSQEWLNVFVRSYEYCNAAKLMQLKLGDKVIVEAEQVPSSKGEPGSLVKAAQQRLLATRIDIPAAPSASSAQRCTTTVSKDSGKGLVNLNAKGSGKSKVGKSNIPPRQIIARESEALPTGGYVG